MPPRAFYHLGYRFFRMPWEIGPRTELVDLVTSGRLRPGRAIDLGCGTGANSVFLAQHGFEVTGIDFAPSAVAKATARAAEAGVPATFLEDDLTGLRHPLGTFDLLVDYGTLDDLSAAHRNRYVDTVLPLAAPGALMLLWCFEWPPRRFDRWTGFRPMVPGEVEQRFGRAFAIERIAASERVDRRRLIPGYAAYLMTRRRQPPAESPTESPAGETA